MHPPVFGNHGFGAGQPGAARCGFKNSLPGAGHIAILHGEGPKVEGLTVCDREAGGIAAFGMLHKVNIIQDFHLCQITAPVGMGEISGNLP